MNLPTNIGTYRGHAVDAVLNKTSTGLPQLVIRFALVEYYDTKEEEWFDVSDYNWEITAYLCLYYRKDGEPEVTMNHTQVCSVYGWDGAGFEFLLDDQNFVGKTVQIRVKENDYAKAKTDVTVSWIDSKDADPNPSLKGISADDAAALADEFASAFAPQPKTKKVAKAAPKKLAKAKPKKAAAAEETVPEQAPQDAVSKKQALAEKSKRLREAQKKEEAEAEANKTTKSKGPKKGAKKTVAAPPEEAPAEAPEEAPVDENYGKNEAWTDIFEMKSDDCDTEQTTEVWRNTLIEIKGDKKEADLDADDWRTVRDVVLNEVGTAD